MSTPSRSAEPTRAHEDDAASGASMEESWLAEQARLVLLEEGLGG